MFGGLYLGPPGFGVIATPKMENQMEIKGKMAWKLDLDLQVILGEWKRSGNSPLVGDLLG